MASTVELIELATSRMNTIGVSGQTEMVIADLGRYPNVVTLCRASDLICCNRLYWCMDKFGPIYTIDDNWSYWNEQHIFGSSENVLYMFKYQKDAVLFKMRWMGAQR